MTKPDNRRTNAIKLTATLIDARPTLRKQADEWAEGFGATSPGHGEPGRGKGGVTRPTENAATQRREGAGLALQCTDTLGDIDKWITHGYELASRVCRLLPLEHPVAEMLQRHAQARFNGAGYCDACGEWVEGSDYKPGRKGRRIDSGMCPTCAQRWRRTTDVHHLGAPEWATREKQRLSYTEPAGQAECPPPPGTVAC